jgi:hypothetical protein
MKMQIKVSTNISSQYQKTLNYQQNIKEIIIWQCIKKTLFSKNNLRYFSKKI